MILNRSICHSRFKYKSDKQVRCVIFGFFRVTFWLRIFFETQLDLNTSLHSQTDELCGPPQRECYREDSELGIIAKSPHRYYVNRCFQ